MATTAPPAPPTATLDANNASIVHQQIERARRTVKLVELFSSGMILLAGALAYLLFAVLVDHWVVPLNGLMRTLTLLAFFAGAGAFIWFRMLPLVLRPINPLYAARSMEQSAQTLKNSLVNFLFFRQNRAGVQEAVFTTLQQRAAADLTSPNVDTAVDVSQAIRVAYVLIAVLVLSAAYTILAPKSAFQSLARVVNPWTNIAAPTRVLIESVEPGDVSVYYGEHVTIRVAVSGQRDNDPVIVRYSTADLQTVDEPIGMERTSDGLYYEAKIPPGNDGVHQDLTYFVEAGDATSRSYDVETNAAPSIVVDQVVYDFPKYTGFSQRIEPRQGDIRGIDGARVTIHAHANSDIRSAAIEFDPTDVGATTEPMKVNGRKAVVSFQLQLNAQGEPVHKSYRLRFFDDQGKKNPNPILHQIHVTRDYPPVVEILHPELRRIEVPLDGEQEIEVRAVDPDFALRQIRLRMVVGESEVFAQSRERAQRGQAVERFAFSPSRLKLHVGDTVMYRAYAEDNRTDLDGNPRPNEERTEEYSIVVTESRAKPAAGGDADAGAESPPDRAAQDSKDSGSGEGAKKPGADSATGDKPEEGESAGADKGEDKGADKGADKGEDKGSDQGDGMGETGSEGDKGKPSKSGDGDKGESGDMNSSASEPGGGDKPGTEQMGPGAGADANADPENAEPSSDQKGQSGGAQKPGAGDPQAQNAEGNDSNAGGGAQPAGSENGNPPQGQAQGAGSPNSNSDPMGPSRDGAGADGKGSPSDGDESGGPATPGQGNPDLSKAQPNDEPLQDGDAVETIKEHIDRSRGQSTGESVRAEDQSNPDSAGSKTRSSGNPEGGQAADPNSAPMTGDGNDPKQGGDTQPMPSPAGGSPNSQTPGGTAKGQDDSQTGDNTASDKPGQGSQKPNGQQSPPNETPRGQNANLGAGKQGDGAQGQSGNPTNGQKPGSDDKAAESGMPTDGGKGDNGDSGDAQKAESSQGSPGAEGQNQDRKKSGKPAGNSGDQGTSEPPPPTTTPKQSDSKGGESGDRSGGGKQGGGQSGKQQGNDSAGSQSAGDEGAGAAQQAGQGDTSASGGNKQPAASPTGVAGDQEGEGSQTRAGDGGEPGGAKSQSPNAQQQSRKVEGQDGSGQIGDGGGLASERPSRGAPAAVRDVADGSEANVEFAKKATNLALDYLKHNPDDKALMDKLGWSDEDRQRFIDRWSRLKRSAREGDDGRRRLNDALEGLGLRRGSDTIRRQATKTDQGGGLQQDGAGPANLPAHLLERFNAYKRGAAKSRD